MEKPKSFLNLPITTCAAVPPGTVALVNVKQGRPLTETELSAFHFGTDEQRRRVLESAFTVSGAVVRAPDAHDFSSDYYGGDDE
jgi:hypothetical protein